ncbi:class III signal peptide-containing protein [uncultured Methanobrevibacter sp.]|uniref:class III signal peptide-containing protein n=1 Tax=uncultured Methanobrevibacter sp. TaxID=253161 RepID=UPI0025CCEBA7|nr:class III signal peptide-containing protein [uncultured Methanobrevibacter sp.]
MFNEIYDELNGQSSAEFILLLGGILIIVLVLFNFYKNYLSDMSYHINSTEISNFNNATERLSNRFSKL